MGRPMPDPCDRVAFIAKLVVGTVWVHPVHGEWRVVDLFDDLGTLIVRLTQTGRTSMAIMLVDALELVEDWKARGV